MEKEDLEFAKYYHNKIRPELMEVVDAQTLVFDKDSYLTKELFDSEFKQDYIVSSVINKFKSRSDVGIKKYGTTLDQNNTDDFLSHAMEESMDFILYLQKIKDTLNKNGFNRLEDLIEKYEKTVTTTENTSSN